MADNDDWERSMLEADEHTPKQSKRPINDSSAIAGHSGVDLRKPKPVKRLPMDVPNRFPPHDTEAEQGVLGCILWSPKEALPECIVRFQGLEPFYDLRHEAVFETMCEMSNKMVAIDIITLQQHLKDKQVLDNVGGIPYLSSLQDKVPSAANLGYYLDILVNKALLRQAIRLCNDFSARAYECEDVSGFIDEIERDALRIRPTNGKDKSIKELVLASVSMYEEIHNSKGKITGIPTGLADLDKLTDGLHASELMLVTGYPSTGKTSLSTNIVEHAVVDLQIPFGIISLEMTAEQLVFRMQGTRARVNPRDVRDGVATERDFTKLAVSASQIAKAPLYIHKGAGMSIDAVRALARRMKQQYGIKGLMIDYLQLMHAENVRKNMNRSEELGLITKGAKNCANELEIPVILLSQINQDGQTYGSREPGQDADTVIRLENIGDWAPKIQQVKCVVEKSRNGPTGNVELTFLKTITKFECAARVADEDLPRPYVE